MAEINKIKVGETTYGINPSWATGDGVTSPIKIGTNGALTIGTAGLISMSTAVEIVGGINVAKGKLRASEGSITLGSTVKVEGTLLVNGKDVSANVGVEGLALNNGQLVIGTGAGVNDVWIGSQYGSACTTYLCASGIILIGSQTDLNLGSIFGYQNFDVANGALELGSGVNGPAKAIRVGAPQKPVEITIGSMYNNHCGIQLVPSQSDGDSIRMTCENALIEFYSGGGIGIHESGNGLNIGTGGKGYVNMDNKVSIGGFLFEADKSTNKLTISYNGKKAEIQLA